MRADSSSQMPSSCLKHVIHAFRAKHEDTGQTCWRDVTVCALDLQRLTSQQSTKQRTRATVHHSRPVPCLLTQSCSGAECSVLSATLLNQCRGRSKAPAGACCGPGLHHWLKLPFVSVNQNRLAFDCLQCSQRALCYGTDFAARQSNRDGSDYGVCRIQHGYAQVWPHLQNYVPGHWRPENSFAVEAVIPALLPC